MRNLLLLSASISSLLLISCGKDFFEKRQNSNLAIPEKLEDFQKILDADIMRETPAFGEISSDDYFMRSEIWTGFPDVNERNTYIWAKEPFEGTTAIADWNTPYRQVFYANAVIEGLDKLQGHVKGTQAYNEILGFALFVRANAFYNLSQIFSPPYDASIANDPNLGIPLKLSANVDDITTRSTIDEVYSRITEDLITASSLLPRNHSSTYRNRPSTNSCYALLCRMYISKRDYLNAKKFADSSLSIYNTLIDYNTISTTATLPFTRLNNETIYMNTLSSDADIILGLRLTVGISVDTLLYKMYDPNDLRKKIFFNDAGNVKGSYGERARFSGLATDEMYLVRSECNARIGDIGKAIDDINLLLRNRYKKNGTISTYTDFTSTNKDEVLNFILNERRKELVHRGIRWSDLRRLNIEGKNIVIKRIVNGTEYILQPNDKKYTAPIPNDVLGFTGIKNNER